MWINPKPLARLIAAVVGMSLFPLFEANPGRMSAAEPQSRKSDSGPTAPDRRREMPGPYAGDGDFVPPKETREQINPTSPAPKSNFLPDVTASEAGGMVIGTLRCEYLTDPCGIDALQPRLSWVMASERRGEVQRAYHILVASTPERLAKDEGDLWDSGKVAKVTP